MARKARCEVEAGVWHVFARGNDRQDVFWVDEDRQRYLATLARIVRLKRWRCLSYCLMQNHVHLLIETSEPNLGDGMRALQGGYAQEFNRRHHRSGHLFQGRYGAVRVTSDAQLWTAAAYVARNPVEAGLCTSPERWPWSSHRATVGVATTPGWLDVARLLGYFASAGGDPRHRYAQFTAV